MRAQSKAQPEPSSPLPDGKTPLTHFAVGSQGIWTSDTSCIPDAPVPVTAGYTYPGGCSNLWDHRAMACEPFCNVSCLLNRIYVLQFEVISLSAENSIAI